MVFVLLLGLLPFGGHQVLLLELLSLVDFYEEFKTL
jgi:hypothetical protein